MRIIYDTNKGKKDYREPKNEKHKHTHLFNHFTMKNNLLIKLLAMFLTGTMLIGAG